MTLPKEGDHPMQRKPRSPLLRAEQVAEIIGVSPRTAADLMQLMPHINIGRSLRKPRWAVTEDDLNAFLASRTAPPELPGPPRPRRRKASPIAHSPYLLDENGHIPRRK